MKKFIVFISIILIVIGILFSTSGHYFGFLSPDHQFSIYSSKYNYEYLLGTEHSYASGKVFLYDQIENKIIAEKKISIISGTQDAQWSEESVSLRCEGLPSFKLPRKIKLPYTVEYKNGVLKVFRPDGSISKEYQILKTNNRLYRIGIEKSYNINGQPSLVNTYEYFPDTIPGRINDSLLTQIIKQDSFRNGIHKAHREYQKSLKDNRTCNCGNWIDYSIEPIRTINYPDCYVKFDDCK